MPNDQIKNNFSKSASTYDNFAQVQKIMASEIKNILLKQKHVFENVLEIGCGTGILSKLLTGSLKPEKLFLNDISPEMIEITKNKLKYKTIKPDFIEGNFEKIEINKFFDGIFSSAVFQWFENIDSSFKKINSILSKNGILAFSIFIDGTFYELDNSFKKTYEELDLPYKRNILKFKTEDELKESLKACGFELKECKITSYVLHFKTPEEFLRSIHKIGAVTPDKKVKYTVMKKMFNNYSKNFTDKNGLIPATYRVLYCLSEAKKQ